MRTVAVIAVILMVALVILSEAKPFGRDRRGNRKGHRDHDSNRRDCHQLRCSRPTRSSRVCASVDGLRNHTFPSACLADRIACITKRNITVVAEGACPRTRAATGGIGRGNREDDSESEEESNSNETNEDTVTVTTTSGPATSPSSEPSTSVTSDRTTSGSTSATSASDGPTNPSTPLVTSTSGSPAATDPTTASLGPAVTDPRVDSPGSTCVTSCPVASSPVCGTDGATYGSACVLEAYACANQIEGLTVASEGVCPT